MVYVAPPIGGVAISLTLIHFGNNFSEDSDKLIQTNFVSRRKWSTKFEDLP